MGSGKLQRRPSGKLLRTGSGLANGCCCNEEGSSTPTDCNCPNYCVTVFAESDRYALLQAPGDPCIVDYGTFLDGNLEIGAAVFFDEINNRWQAGPLTRAFPAWEGIYYKAASPCPDGIYDLAVTNFGTPPATVEVVSGGCCIDCANPCVEINDGVDTWVIESGASCEYGSFISGPPSTASTTVVSVAGRWKILDLANDPAGWAGDYEGPTTECPDGTYTLIPGTEIGTPPASVTVTSGACPP